MTSYTGITPLNEKHGVGLVKDEESGRIYVRKVLTYYDLSVFKYLKENSPQGIPLIKEYYENDGRLVVIEEYISGSSLAGRRTDENEAAGIVESLCDILNDLHRAHIVHRDIKPSNVIVDDRGKVWLIDFDAARSYAGGRRRDTTLIGTEGYAAPEQYGFGSSDARTDIYALGVLLCELVSGSAEPERLGAGLRKVAHRCLAMDPGDRYQSVKELRAALCGDSRDRRLPGFRGSRPIVKVAAVLWYSLIVLFSISCAMAGEEPAWLYGLIYFALIFLPTLYLGNYRGIRDRLPWKNRNSIPAAVMGTVIIIGAVFIIGSLIYIVISG